MNPLQIIKKTALDTIKIELEGIKSLLDSINDDFTNCVQAIFASKGRLVITGIGKSALVGQKIVATLNSTGTPSLFMHAADAIHGDLGMIRPEDHVMCISKSGETGEIKVLVPLLKNMNNPLIGVTSNANSFLAKNANYLLHTPITQEADPNNLAPTTSTTAQMVMGDALATALLALRGFTASDFAKYHPGGSLGKTLYLKIADIYPFNEKPLVHAQSTINEVILEMSAKRLGATAVCDDNQKTIGIITDGDLRRMLKDQKDIHNTRAIDIMSPSPKTVHKDTLAAKAFNYMKQHSISQLIVVDDEDIYLGVVHIHDFIREGLV